MPAPKAMSSSVKTPGFYLRVNLLAAASAPGAGLVTAALVAHSVGGNITANAEVRTCYGPDDVATAIGANSPGRLFADQFFRKVKTIPLDVVAPTAPSGSTATITHVITGTPEDTNTWELEVAGRTTVVDWYAGETIATFLARCVAAISAIRPLPAVAGEGDPGELVIDAAGPGTWGNDITTAARKLRGTGGVPPQSGDSSRSSTRVCSVTWTRWIASIQSSLSWPSESMLFTMKVPARSGVDTCVVERPTWAMLVVACSQSAVPSVSGAHLIQ